jgi:hypothetical protein
MLMRDAYKSEPTRWRQIAGIKNDHWLHHRAAALNLRRLINLGLHHTGTNWVIA